MDNKYPIPQPELEQQVDQMFAVSDKIVKGIFNKIVEAIREQE